MIRHALIDADVVAYKAAAVCEEEVPWDDENPILHVDEPKLRREIDDYIAKLADKLRADSVIICLSDPQRNWRKEFDATYKSNRRNTKRPELLLRAKTYMAREYRSYIVPRLEGDDVMGILATHPTLLEGQKIIVSEDKDMRTVPARVYNPGRPELGVQRISPLDAHRFHMWQTIVGDPTDGYPGCPGVGKKSVYAEEVVFAHRRELWDIVLDAYASKGLTEDHAIHQARLARILRATDYKFSKRRVRLWNPLFLHW